MQLLIMRTRFIIINFNSKNYYNRISQGGIIFLQILPLLVLFRIKYIKRSLYLSHIAHQAEESLHDALFNTVLDNLLRDQAINMRKPA
jgi:hypothetical protein